MKKHTLSRALAAILALALLASLAACGGAPSSVGQDDSQSGSQSSGQSASGTSSGSPDSAEQGAAPAPAAARELLLQDMRPQYDANLQPDAPQFAVAEDFSNVINLDQFEYTLDGEARQKLLQNGFVVVEDQWAGYNEFHDLYEMNRYNLKPSFITSDAMMHTYHLYFSRLLKGLEKDSLLPFLTEISQAMQAQSEQQLSELVGTAWEAAAQRNLAFFTVGRCLLEPGAEIPSQVQELVNAELALIESAAAVEISPIMNVEPSQEPLYEDYTQYIPRGYYDASEELSRYFRAMMWYGRQNFRAADDSQSRSALLMELALENSGAKETWSAIYAVTSFFMGASDDAGPYEYGPIIETAYNGWPEVSSLPGNESGWQAFQAAAAALKMPAINSIPVPEGQTAEEREAAVMGFGFMGKRFVLVEAFFQKLIYDAVGEDAAGSRRMLPSALDVPAALGSDTARAILAEGGADAFHNYTENMDALRQGIASAPDTLWTASLYGGWLDTLRPLLIQRGEGWPRFMQTDAWAKKSLNTFLGSWTELKHDTILYAKQVLAEMGGGPVVERDERGFVCWQPELYAKLAALCDATSEGLARYGALPGDIGENLARLSELAHRLAVISEKELSGMTPDAEEFELIRDFGGQLEHFWYDAMKDEADTEYFTSQEYPAAVVADVATDPNGQVLEVGTGGIKEIFVVVSVEGSLRIACGGIYSFYEFAWPMENRLTDTEWRDMMGVTIQWTENGYVEPNPPVSRPAWTDAYMVMRQS